jgi:hypothetical protein
MPRAFYHRQAKKMQIVVNTITRPEFALWSGLRRAYNQLRKSVYARHSRNLLMHIPNLVIHSQFSGWVCGGSGSHVCLVDLSLKQLMASLCLVCRHKRWRRLSPKWLYDSQSQTSRFASIYLSYYCCTLWYTDTLARCRYQFVPCYNNNVWFREYEF